ncbi:translation initiation inhibitor [bacterium]|nr:translation initiation inhibitor [bacterium]
MKPAIETDGPRALACRVCPRAGCDDVYAHATLRDFGSPREMFHALAALAAMQRVRVVSLEALGMANERGQGRALLEQAFEGVDFPVTWLDEGAASTPHLAGVVMHAVAGAAVKRLKLRGRTVGSVYDDGAATYCILRDLRPEDTSLPRGQQARIVFDDMVAALRLAGMAFADVVRTWFWNDRMLEWYDEFNAVRTAFFNEHRVFDGLLPASTGIGAHNAAGAAVVAGLMAMQPKGKAVRVSAVDSPLQCAATEYGSSFSRATEIETPAYRHLFVSGTASITPGGETMHPGDGAKQIGRTMDVVEAILASRGMAWGDVASAVCYCRHAACAAQFDRWCAARGIASFPHVAANFVVCRDDLEFEIELDASVSQ